MRTPSGTLGTHFDDDSTTLARLLTVNRADGVIIRLTDHDADIDIPSRSATATSDLTLEDNEFGVAVKSSARLNITSGNNALNAETVTVGARVYTFETAFTDTADFVLIGVDRSATLLNLANAINNGSGEGTTYGTGTVIHADVTATAPNQSSSSDLQIGQSVGSVIGNMTLISSLNFGGTNEQAFDGDLVEWSARCANRVATAGKAYIGKTFSTPEHIKTATVWGTNNEGWWNPASVLSLEMTFELRGKTGAVPSDFFTEGTVLGTSGPFINPHGKSVV